MSRIIRTLFYIIYIYGFVIAQFSAEDINASKELDEILNMPGENSGEVELKKKIIGYPESKDKVIAEWDEEREKERQAGDIADLFGTNQHYNIPVNYQDFGRRFVPVYPYSEKNKDLRNNYAAESRLHNIVMQHLEDKKASDARLKPVKASPEFVLSVAKQSALLEATRPKNPTDEVIKKNILRTGDYWDGVWKEDLDEKQMLRSGSENNHNLEPVTVELSPGSKLYELISMLIKKSPRLLYVINNKV